MAKDKVTIFVDKRFFDTIFEKERNKMQKKIGIINLSQVNFSKMIKGFDLRLPKQDISLFTKKRRRRKRNVNFKI